MEHHADITPQHHDARLDHALALHLWQSLLPSLPLLADASQLSITQVKWLLPALIDETLLTLSHALQQADLHKTFKKIQSLPDIYSLPAEQRALKVLAKSGNSALERLAISPSPISTNHQLINTKHIQPTGAVVGMDAILLATLIRHADTIKWFTEMNSSIAIEHGSQLSEKQGTSDYALDTTDSKILPHTNINNISLEKLQRLRLLVAWLSLYEVHTLTELAQLDAEELKVWLELQPHLCPALRTVLKHEVLGSNVHQPETASNLSTNTQSTQNAQLPAHIVQTLQRRWMQKLQDLTRQRQRLIPFAIGLRPVSAEANDQHRKTLSTNAKDKSLDTIPNNTQQQRHAVASTTSTPNHENLLSSHDQTINTNNAANLAQSLNTQRAYSRTAQSNNAEPRGLSTASEMPIEVPTPAPLWKNRTLWVVIIGLITTLALVYWEHQNRRQLTAERMATLQAQKKSAQDDLPKDIAIIRTPDAPNNDVTNGTNSNSAALQNNVSDSGNSANIDSVKGNSANNGTPNTN